MHAVCARACQHAWLQQSTSGSFTVLAFSHAHTEPFKVCVPLSTTCVLACAIATVAAAAAECCPRLNLMMEVDQQFLTRTNLVRYVGRMHPIANGSWWECTGRTLRLGGMMTTAHTKRPVKACMQCHVHSSTKCDARLSRCIRSTRACSSKTTGDQPWR